MKTAKENLFTMLLCLTLILPLTPVWAQDTDEALSDDTSSGLDSAGTAAPETVAPETAVPKEAAPETAAPKTAAETTAPKTGGQTPSLKAPKIQGAPSLTAIINKIIGYISQIGAIFGKSAGTRIGGTSGSAIVMLVIAKLIQDRGPDWLRWLLYLSGGTMVAGSGANITKLIMGLLS
jgi:hypothetical protein